MRRRFLPLCLAVVALLYLGCSQNPTGTQQQSEVGMAAGKPVKVPKDKVSFDVREFRVVQTGPGEIPADAGVPGPYDPALLLMPDEDVMSIETWNWVYVHVVCTQPLEYIALNVSHDRVPDQEHTNSYEYFYMTNVNGFVGEEWDQLPDNEYEYKGYLRRPFVGQRIIDSTERNLFPDQIQEGNDPNSFNDLYPGADPYVFVMGAGLVSGDSYMGLELPPPSPDRVAWVKGPTADNVVTVSGLDLSFAESSYKYRGKYYTEIKAVASFQLSPNPYLNPIISYQWVDENGTVLFRNLFTSPDEDGIYRLEYAGIQPDQGVTFRIVNVSSDVAGWVWDPTADTHEIFAHYSP